MERVGLRNRVRELSHEAGTADSWVQCGSEVTDWQQWGSKVESKTTGRHTHTHIHFLGVGMSLGLSNVIVEQNFINVGLNTPPMPLSFHCVLVCVCVFVLCPLSFHYNLGSCLVERLLLFI